MAHTILITLHAVAGTVALLAGAVAIRGRALFAAYLWSLVAMVVFLLAATVVAWAGLDTATRVLFTAFAVLGLVMVWRARQAGRLRPARSRPPSSRYVAHVGFTLVALFDAFVVITVLNSGAPVWLVVAAGLAVAVAGHFVLTAVARKITEAAEPGTAEPAR